MIPFQETELLSADLATDRQEKLLESIFHHLSPRGPLELLFSYVQLHRNGPKMVVEADVELLASDRLVDSSKVIMFKDLRGAMVSYRDRRDASSFLYVGRWS